MAPYASSSSFNARYARQQIIPSQNQTHGGVTEKYTDWFSIFDYGLVDAANKAPSGYSTQGFVTSPLQWNASHYMTALSYKYYNTTTLTWVLNLINGVTNSYTLPTATILQIPAFNSLEDLIQRLQVLMRVNSKSTVNL